MSRNSIPYRPGYSLRTRLYAIIGFLALLPFCGLLGTFVVLQTSAQDDAALERLSRGSVDLERINGLIYAVVMDSRGIYMSPDWASAEQFALGIPPALAEMQQVARAWKQEAIAGEQSNVEELGRRIDQFVEFRTELVRLAKEESTAAARAVGDNAANRNVRKALNQSLTSLARAYEQETDRARGKAASDGRYFMIVLGALAGIAVIGLCGGLLMVHNALLKPLLGLKDRMLRLAMGKLGGAADGRHQRALEIAEMAQAVETFRSDLVDRQRLNHEAEVLSSLNEWLQSCNSLGELYEMVALFLATLLPGCSGSLYVYANSRNVLEGATVWNGATMKAAMHPDDCWALRRGRTYAFGDSEIGIPCAHVGTAEPEPYCCIPILAHSETVGVLHLKFPLDHDAAHVADRRRLGVVCAEHISLAIANVKLRDQLRDQSIRDPLTGLFNRRYLLETGTREFARAARARDEVGILSIDVDHFKNYNDEHGHDAGDTVLRAVGSCLQSAFRNEDVPCRFGGEEFVVLLPGAGIDLAARRAEQLRTAIESLVVGHLGQNLPRITISIGVAAFPQAGDALEGVLRAADEAMYRAKANGRNRVETATPGDGSKPGPVDPGPAAPPLLIAAADG